MNNHPAITRLLLVAVPTAALAGLFFVGYAVGLFALALGIALVAARWRSLGPALFGPQRRPWWIVPAFGIALIAAAVGITQLPGPGDVVWGLATLVGVIGSVTALGSVLLSLIGIARRPRATSAY